MVGNLSEQDQDQLTEFLKSFVQYIFCTVGDRQLYRMSHREEHISHIINHSFIGVKNRSGIKIGVEEKD